MPHNRAITGIANLGGTLNVTAQSGIKLAKSDSYTIMSFASSAGEFATTNLPPGMTIVYDATSVMLVQH